MGEPVAITSTTLGQVESDDIRLELLWQQLTAAVRGDCLTLINAIRIGGSHHRAAYFLEGFLYVRLHGSHFERQRLPKIRSVGRPRSLHARTEGNLYKACALVENMDDPTYPLDVKLDMLGRSIDLRHKLNSLEQELLFLACLTTILDGLVPGGSFATLIRAEYEALSLRISQGERVGLLLREPRSKAA